MLELHQLLRLERGLISFDFETTGVNPSSDRIVQIGMCRIKPTGEYKEWMTFVNPTIPIPPRATETHGITNEMVKDAPTFREMGPKLAKAMEGYDLLGYNAGNFDAKMLVAEFARIGVTWESPLIVDAFRIWQKLIPRNLTAYVEEYGRKDRDGNPVELSPEEEEAFKAHDALHDSRWTMRAFRNFLLRHPETPRTVQELHDFVFKIERDPNALDKKNLLVWRDDGKAYFNFGKKHRDRSLQEVAAIDPRFFDWILREDFEPDFKMIISDARRGVFPKRGQ